MKEAVFFCVDSMAKMCLTRLPAGTSILACSKLDKSRAQQFGMVVDEGGLLLRFSHPGLLDTSQLLMWVEPWFTTGGTDPSGEGFPEGWWDRAVFTRWGEPTALWKVGLSGVNLDVELAPFLAPISPFVLASCLGLNDEPPPLDQSLPAPVKEETWRDRPPLL